jgi:hypothetical protein
MKASGSPPTMALADLLIGLLELVPMSEVQIARATGADRATVAYGSSVGRLPTGCTPSG